MRTTRQLSITPPYEMADALRERVRAGAYASESEVIRDGLRALFALDQEVEAPYEARRSERCRIR